MTPETKVAEQLANLTESRWFNPASLGRYLADQPYYTIDRIMEMIVYIISNNAHRHDREMVKGHTSEGLFLAGELNTLINEIKDKYVFDNLNLPK
jgi:hypothetical protein